MDRQASLPFLDDPVDDVPSLALTAEEVRALEAFADEVADRMERRSRARNAEDAEE